MGIAELFMLYLFPVFLMVLTFSIGILLGTELPSRFRKRVDADAIQAAHGETISRIDDAVDYYIGLQSFIADRLDGLKPGPRRSGVRSNANKEESQNGRKKATAGK